MTSDRPALGAGSRRRYSAELKAQVVTQCDARGASVAKVAMSHGINANVVHRWRQLVREGGAAALVRTSEFIPVSLAAAAVAPAGDIQVQLRRGATAMTITWPVSASAEFAGWMRELLR
jgi:transposase